MLIDALRIDSTVNESNIADPLDSQMLNDGVSVLNRMIAVSFRRTDLKFRFTDQRKQTKSLAFQIVSKKI